MKRIKSILFCAIMLTVVSCSKDDENGGPRKGNFGGNIIYEYTSDVKTIDLNTWQESAYFSYSAYSTIGWDVSRDGKVRLVSEREAGNYTSTKFTVVNTSDASIIKTFEYDSKYGNGQNYAGRFSYDASLILIQPDLDNGLVILDTDGNVKHRLDGINGEGLTLGDRGYWMPDNSILITFQDKYILRAAPPYTSLTLVKEMNYESWGGLRVNYDGTKISMYVGKHIHLMNTDGTGLTQVTESTSDENMAEFSPDGKYLLVGGDYVHAPLSGRSSWYLYIIPADGKIYNLDGGPGVTPVIPTNDTSPVKAGGGTYWRP